MRYYNPEGYGKTTHCRLATPEGLPFTEAQDRLFPGTAGKATQTIEVDRLADYLSAADLVSSALLKLDV